MRIIGFIMLFCSIAFNIKAQEVKFEQADKERLVRVEVKLDESIKSIQKQIDDLKHTTQKQIDVLDKKIDDLRTFLLWGFGILFGGMAILIGFVTWDRRTAVEPVAKKNAELENRQKEIEEREEKVIKALKKMTQIEPRFAEILKTVGL